MKKFYTMSDAGSVRIGNGDFKILIPNGYGDGDTTVKIYYKNDEKPEFNNSDFFTVVENYFDIFDYDCSNATPVATLQGRFAVYIPHEEIESNGIVVFKEL